jgi:HK97 family phage prohead protease
MKEYVSSVVRREIHPVISVPEVGLRRSERRAEDSTPYPVVDFVASDETLDRYGEVLVASGWRLENYRKNPVVQNAHNYGDVLFTIGRAVITEVRGGALYQRIEFATEVNPVARIAYGLYKGGFLNAVSVGFVPKRWVDGGPKDGFRRKYIEQELVEVSAVGIPANPNALQLGLSAGAVEKGDLIEVVGRLEELFEESKKEEGRIKKGERPLIRPSGTFSPSNGEKAQKDFCSQLADISADTSALGRGIDGAQWGQVTQLLEEVRAVLRRA